MPIFMKKDLYNHITKYNDWKEGLTPKYIEEEFNYEPFYF